MPSSLFERMTAIARRGGNVAEKADYVRAQRGSDPGRHHCHWPGCTTKVPPAMWGCFPHWTRLPRSLQAKIWRTFRPGQEVSKTPSREYIEVAREVQEWIEGEVCRERAVQRGWRYDL